MTSHQQHPSCSLDLQTPEPASHSAPTTSSYASGCNRQMGYEAASSTVGWKVLTV